MPENSKMDKMTKTVLLLLIFTLPLTIIGCGNSDSQQGAVPLNSAATDDTSRLCSSIETTGLVKQCVVNSPDNSVHVTIDSFDDDAARNVCADVANRMARLTAHFSGHWMLQVFSHYRSDKPMASCPLH
jgi:hypothetical protein